MIHPIANAMEWNAKSRGATSIFNYIDNLIVVGPPQLEVCKLSLRTLTQTCDILGMCINHEKTEGPATRLTVLGIELNYVVHGDETTSKKTGAPLYFP